MRIDTMELAALKVLGKYSLEVYMTSRIPHYSRDVTIFQYCWEVL